jgi:hypothetical protein
MEDQEKVKDSADEWETAAREAIEGMRQINKTVVRAVCVTEVLMVMCTLAILLALDPQHTFNTLVLVVVFGILALVVFVITIGLL